MTPLIFRTKKNSVKHYIVKSSNIFVSFPKIHQTLIVKGKIRIFWSPLKTKTKTKNFTIEVKQAK